MFGSEVSFRSRFLWSKYQIIGVIFQKSIHVNYQFSRISGKIPILRIIFEVPFMNLLNLLHYSLNF